MQTPEEFAWTLYAEEMDFHDHSWRDPEATARLIRARDAAVAAKALREASFIFDHTNDYEGSAVISYLTGRADRIEREEGVLPSECCASGRCEVCTPGFEWGWDG